MIHLKKKKQFMIFTDLKEQKPFIPLGCRASISFNLRGDGVLSKFNGDRASHENKFKIIKFIIQDRRKE